jgi:iron complex transport system ATP-binding protein
MAARMLHHAYGPTRAITDVDVSVDQGEFVGIIGPNGSGKTTLLRILAGILRPRPGEVRIGGKDLHEMPPRERARAIALVPQQAEVAFEFTVGEVVLLGRAPHLFGMGFEREEDVRIARESLEAVDASHLADRPITALSGGERQRAMIARALAQRTPILLLDEPTAHLDLRHQIEIYEMLRRMNHEEATTIVVVSHDLNLPARYCRRIVALKEGRIAADGPPDRVIRREEIERIFGARVRVVDHGGPVVIPAPDAKG